MRAIVFDSTHLSRGKPYKASSQMSLMDCGAMLAHQFLNIINLMTSLLGSSYSMQAGS